METFGMICTIIGVGTLSWWFMRLVEELDRGGVVDELGHER